MKVMCKCGAMVEIPYTDRESPVTCSRCNSPVQLQKAAPPGATRAQGDVVISGDVVKVGLFKGVPIVLLSYVALMIFLPIFQINCAGLKMAWTGMDLVQGRDPQPPKELLAMAGGKQNPEQQQAEYRSMFDGGKAPNDLGVLGFPLAALGAIAAIALGRKAMASILIVVLAAVFMWHTFAGFKVERVMKAEMPKKMADDQRRDQAWGMAQDAGAQMGMAMIGSMFERTAWFWIGLVCTILALAVYHIPTVIQLTVRGPPPPLSG